MPEFDDEHDLDRGPSKSELKREARALQELGREVLELPHSHFAQMPLSGEMHDAMALYKRLHQREARRRQLQFIGKRMREEDVEGIRAALQNIRDRDRLFRQHFHKLEGLRDKLVAEGDAALGEVLTDHPHLDKQHLRQLIRQAHKEARENKPPAASRKLFRYLADTIGIGSTAPDE